MTVRPLPPDQIDQILPLLSQVHDLHVMQRPDYYRPIEDPEAVLTWLQRWVSAGDITTLVCGPAAALTGYLIYAIERHDASVLKPATHRAVLEHICVDANHRRAGLGRALVATMRQRVRAEGIDHIATTYATFNKASAALMAREGFVPTYIRAEMSA